MRLAVTILVFLSLLVPGGTAHAGDGEETVATTRIPLPHRVPDETDWYGVYQERVKQGYAMLGLHYVPGEEPTYVSRSRIDAVLVGLGQIHFYFETEDVFRGTPPYELLSSREVRREGSTERRIDLRRVGDGYRVTSTVDDEEETREFPDLGYTLADRLTHIHWAREEREQGDTIHVREFDITELRHDVFTYEVEAVLRVPARGIEVTVYEVAMRSKRKGKLGTLWIDTEGRVIRGPLAGVAEMRVETEKQARETRLATDLFGLGRVPVNKKLEELPERLVGLTVGLYGRGASRFETGPRQEVRGDEEADRIVSAGLAQGKDDATEEECQAALEATAVYPAKDERIVALAKRVAGDWVEPEARVERLVAHVGSMLTDVHLAEPFPVLQLLDEGVGDVRDHARLFVTLARSLGIPAREVYGLVYLGDDALAFGGHAWCEVALDGRWVPVDPTLGQVPTDPSHLASVRGGKGWVEMLAGFRGLGAEVVFLTGGP